MSHSNTAYWARNPVETFFLEALSAITPAWERLFADVATYHKQYIKDNELRARIDTFAAEELAHARAHDMHNAARGLTGLADAETEYLKPAYRRLSSKRWLAAMVSIESLASSIARWFLTRYTADVSREVQTGRWHSGEELGHKALAIDVWDARGFDRDLLKPVLVRNQRYVLTKLVRHVYQRLREDRLLWLPATWWQLAALSCTMVIWVFIPARDVLNPDFHPNDIDDTLLLKGLA